MSAFFSKSCEYGLQAVMFIAERGSDRPLPLQEIASVLHLPYNFLSKILQKLAHAGIVKSHRGQRGGFELAKNAEKITLNDIVVAIDGASFLHECVVGFPECSDVYSCSVHPYWKVIRQHITQLLTENNLDNLSRGMSGKIAQLNAALRKYPRPKAASVSRMMSTSSLRRQ